MPKGKTKRQEDVTYSVRIVSPSTKTVKQVSNTTGFEDIGTAHKYLRVHGMNNDQYSITRHQGDKCKQVDEGVVGKNLTNEQGQFTHYHYVTSYRSPDGRAKVKKANQERIAKKQKNQKKGGKKR